MINAQVLIFSCAITAAANAAAFTLTSAGEGCGSGWNRCNLGSPIYSTAEIYQNPFGSSRAPMPVFIDWQPELVEDSYVGMDPVGPSTVTYASNTTHGITDGDGGAHGHFDSQAVYGAWVGGAVPSGIDPWGGHGVFIAQITTTGTLWNDDVGTPVYTQEHGSVWLKLNGDRREGLTMRTTSRPSLYGHGTVYQIWITDTPAPGTTALLLAAPFAWSRRR